MANISRNTFSPTKHYDKLILQRLVPWVDADLNEAQDIQRWKLRNIIELYIGDGSPDYGFKCVGNGLSNDFLIGTGNLFVGGNFCVKEAGENYKTQVDYPTPPVLSPPGIGTRDDLVYIQVQEVEISMTEDPNIVDPTLLIEACRRVKLRFRVCVLEGSTTLPADVINPAGFSTWYFELGRLTRIAGQNAINIGDLVDTRTPIPREMSETPPDTIDGSNRVFTLGYAPVPNTPIGVKVFSDGIRLNLDQYTVSGNILTFNVGDLNIPTDSLVVDYKF